ncbi:MAG TPA: hypothetical protein VEJ84_10530, partial [Acidimicrobiales bacterium]|nr:hypothetical protein [Acidimicrobiales bacterium]
MVYNIWMPRPPPRAVTVTYWAVGLGLSGAALVRALRPERSTVDIAVTAATPWLLAPSWALLAAAVSARRRR